MLNRTISFLKKNWVWLKFVLASLVVITLAVLLFIAGKKKKSRELLEEMIRKKNLELKEIREYYKNKEKTMELEKQALDRLRRNKDYQKKEHKKWAKNRVRELRKKSKERPEEFAREFSREFGITLLQ